MNSDGKIFVGGIGDTRAERLKQYFSKYGVVTDVIVMKDKSTKRSRGFGFIKFENNSINIDAIVQEKHSIDGKNVEAKHISSTQDYTRGENNNVVTRYKSKKIFVGGLPNELTEDEFRNYFQNYGNVTHVVIMLDRNTNRCRGFGFVSFDSEDAVNNLLEGTRFHELGNKMVELKAVVPPKNYPNWDVFTPEKLPSSNSFYPISYHHHIPVVPYHHHFPVVPYHHHFSVVPYHHIPVVPYHHISLVPYEPYFPPYVLVLNPNMICIPQ